MFIRANTVRYIFMPAEVTMRLHNINVIAATVNFYNPSVSFLKSFRIFDLILNNEQLISSDNSISIF